MPRSCYGQKNFPADDGVCRGVSSFRFEFLEAVAENHPEVLRQLYECTYEAYGLAVLVLQHLYFGPSAFLWEEVTSQRDVPVVAHLITSIESWGMRFALTADWIYDVALATLDEWHDCTTYGEVIKWRWTDPPWFPEGIVLPVQTFTLSCDGWDVAFELWQDFENRLYREYCRRKEEYRETITSQSRLLPRVETRRGTTHAQWLAMRQIQSRKYGEIAEAYSDGHRQIDESTVRLAVTTLGKRIGLSPRSLRRKQQ
jgi:hypothetical protein